MNTVRGYNAAFFGNGVQLDAKLSAVPETKELELTECASLSVKDLQENNCIHVFTDAGRYHIVYHCAFKHIEMHEQSIYRLRLVSFKFFRNLDHESEI